MDERYELHARIQEARVRANVSFRHFKAFHHISYTTFYQFIKNPEVARPKTLTSVRLVCEFLEAACQARLLPIPKEKRKEKFEILDKLYDHWWDNGKSFKVKEPVEQEEVN